jgi:metallo-beta-lactamase class B
LGGIIRFLCKFSAGAPIVLISYEEANTETWSAAMISRLTIALPVVVAVLLSGSAPAAGADPDSIVDAERAALRQSLCPPPDTPAPDFAALFDTARQRMAPVRIFDNLYFVGMKTVSAWAVTTSEGIILMDAMFHYNVKETVVDGLRALGLDPGTIRYVIVTHAHNDHFGGAKYLQDTYGARIVLSAADWDHMTTWPQLGSPAPLPKRDIEAQDGDEITLGDTTIRLVLTPGHTPGTLSAIIPVRDNGAPHLIGYWGGGAVSFLKPEEIELYIRSAQRFVESAKGVDVELSNHAGYDGTLLKIDALQKRRPGEAHPFVTGTAGFARWMSDIGGCAGEVLERKRHQDGQ